jgi:hypothetical protein
VVTTGLSAMVLGPSPDVPPLKRVVVTRGGGVAATTGDGDGVGPTGLLPQPVRKAARTVGGISIERRNRHVMTCLLSRQDRVTRPVASSPAQPVRAGKCGVTAFED